MDDLSEAVVTVAAGSLRGRAAGSAAAVTCWLGVPYAAPPVGPLRFRPPQPVTSWSGVRPATAVGAAASQVRGVTTSSRSLGAGQSEDCLYLNVHAPSAAAADEQLRPVLVWLHGGAFTSGSGALYDGAPLAGLGDLVVVTVNYRLGVFGFTDLAAAVHADVASNLGLRDQVAALEWVRDNIAAFGGDPARVTVAGESAGSISVSLLTTAPSARGLFRAAIMQSGSYSLIHGPEVSQEIARAHTRRLGIGPRGGERLWQLPAETLLAVQRDVDRATPGTLPAAPWFDGDVVPASLAEAQAAVRPDLPLLAGHNHDEVTLFQLLPGDIMPTRRPEIISRLRADLGWGAAERVLAEYPDTATGTRALGTDLNFARPTLHFAERHRAAGGRTFCYRFDARVPVLGATHASELVYLWGWSGTAGLVLRGRPTEARSALAARLQQHWVAFVRDDDPGDGWPTFELPDRAVQVFDPAGDHVERDPDRARRLAWAGRDVMPRA